MWISHQSPTPQICRSRKGRLPGSKIIAETWKHPKNTAHGNVLDSGNCCSPHVRRLEPLIGSKIHTLACYLHPFPSRTHPRDLGCSRCSVRHCYSCMRSGLRAWIYPAGFASSLRHMSHKDADGRGSCLRTETSREGEHIQHPGKQPVTPSIPSSLLFFPHS